MWGRGDSNLLHACTTRARHPFPYYAACHSGDTWFAMPAPPYVHTPVHSHTRSHHHHVAHAHTPTLFSHTSLTAVTTTPHTTHTHIPTRSVTRPLRLLLRAWWTLRMRHARHTGASGSTATLETAMTRSPDHALTPGARSAEPQSWPAEALPRLRQQHCIVLLGRPGVAVVAPALCSSACPHL